MTSSPVSGTQRQSAVTALRVIFALVGCVALVLGYIGLDKFLDGRSDLGHGVFDLVYYDIQLFVLGSDPLQDATGLPIELQFARFLAPLFTLLAVVEAARLLLASEVHRLRARRSRGHAVVCGDSSVARTLAARLQADGCRVVVVRGNPIGILDFRRRGLFGVAGDASNPDVLRGAGVEHAAVIYACTDEYAVNVAIAHMAARLIRERRNRVRRRLALVGARALADQVPERPAAVYAQIHDPELWVSLRARRLGLAQPPGLRVDFFNVEDLSARVLFSLRPLTPNAAGPPRLLIAGASAFTRAVIVEAARHWRQIGRTRLVIDYVAPGAVSTLASMSRRYPFLAETCQLEGHEMELAEFLASAVLDDPYDRAFVCHENEADRLRVALADQNLLRCCAGSIVVPLDRLAGVVTAFHDRPGDQLLDEVHGKLLLYPMVEAACDPALISEDLVERLARLTHERYVASCRRRGDTPAVNRSMVAWSDLNDDRLRANRLQAQDIGAKLQRIHCVVVPRLSAGASFAFRAEEIEKLAEEEHERWCGQFGKAGWSWGPDRDETHLRHPDLVVWTELSEEVREKNRDAIRDMPNILADAGFEVVRIVEPMEEGVNHADRR